MSERVLAIRHDDTGRPCAWGTAPTIDGAEAEAERQWQVHLAKNPEAKRGKLTLQAVAASEGTS